MAAGLVSGFATAAHGGDQDDQDEDEVEESRISVRQEWSGESEASERARECQLRVVSGELWNVDQSDGSLRTCFTTQVASCLSIPACG
jgi:hypothetical protein